MQELLNEEDETEVIFLDDSEGEEEEGWNRMNQVLLLHNRKPTND